MKLAVGEGQKNDLKEECRLKFKFFIVFDSKKDIGYVL